MTNLTCQNRTTGQTQKIAIAKVACRRDIIDYVARAYPHLHIVSFDA